MRLDDRLVRLLVMQVTLLLLNTCGGNHLRAFSPVLHGHLMRQRDRRHSMTIALSGHKGLDGLLGAVRIDFPSGLLDVQVTVVAGTVAGCTAGHFVSRNGEILHRKIFRVLGGILRATGVLAGLSGLCAACSFFGLVLGANFIFFGLGQGLELLLREVVKVQVVIRRLHSVGALGKLVGGAVQLALLGFQLLRCEHALHGTLSIELKQKTLGPGAAFVTLFLAQGLALGQVGLSALFVGFVLCVALCCSNVAGRTGDGRFSTGTCRSGLLGARPLLLGVLFNAIYLQTSARRGLLIDCVFRGWRTCGTGNFLLRCLGRVRGLGGISLQRAIFITLGIVEYLGTGSTSRSTSTGVRRSVVLFVTDGAGLLLRRSLEVSSGNSRGLLVGKGIVQLRQRTVMALALRLCLMSSLRSTLAAEQTRKGLARVILRLRRHRWRSRGSTRSRPSGARGSSSVRLAFAGCVAAARTTLAFRAVTCGRHGETCRSGGIGGVTSVVKHGWRRQALTSTPAVTRRICTVWLLGSLLLHRWRHLDTLPHGFIIVRLARKLLLLLLSAVHTGVASTTEGAQATIGAGVVKGRSAGAIRRALKVSPSAISAATVFVAVVLEEVVAAEVIVGIVVTSAPAAVWRALSWCLTWTLRVALTGVISPSLVEATVALVDRGRQAKRRKCRILSMVRWHRTSCTGPTGTGSTRTRRRRSITCDSIILAHRALAQTLGLEFLCLVAGLFDALLLRI
mmetsp:Transcript_10459/g.18233  ORF Transcript_10459/g.18233 Transcript_10459/m.18233 type:complete len:735 (-) Transcript_10459:952-3156(-)